MTTLAVLLFTTFLGGPFQTDSYDTLSPRMESGFYLAIDDPGKSEGMRHFNREDYYFLKVTAAISFKEVKSVEKDLLGDFNGQALIFTFDKKADRKWYKFTKDYTGQKMALVVDNKLIYVARIGEPIRGGGLSLTGAYTDQQVDDFLALCRQEITLSKSVSTR